MDAQAMYDDMKMLDSRAPRVGYLVLFAACTLYVVEFSRVFTDGYVV